jgi:XTP/dITP diphosphohydrolase
MPAAPNRSHLDQPKTWGEKIKFLSSADFKLPAPDETGTTFLENATIKALHTAQATERPALADDSGLCVNALNGAPGVYTADWAEITKGGVRDFDMAMRKVHAALGDATDRSAAFVCCLALAWPDGHVESVEGRIQGTIIWPPSGDSGFGYDPIFRPQGQILTYAELSPEFKNADSHRARAFRALLAKCF